jgi:hypothetical protein
MIPTRRLWALPALALALVLGACSTPDDLTTPTLEPQFGTANEDVATDIVVGASGAVFSLYNYVGPAGYEDYGDDYGYYYDLDEAARLSRYNATGGVVWQKKVLDAKCWDYYCHRYRAEAVHVDANNYTYVLLSEYYAGQPDDSRATVSYSVAKYAPMGEQVNTFYLGYFEAHKSSVAYKMAVDTSGNFYIAAQGNNYEGSNYLAKYTSSGNLVWKRASNTVPAYGTPTDLTVSSSGSIYVVGTKGLSRYSNAGDQVWSRTGLFDQVVISGSNIYTRYRKDIRKWDGNGKQLWLKTQSGLKTLVLQDLDGDGSGNIYLSGKYEVSGADWNAMTRKLNASGSTVWTKTYGTSAFDDAVGIATVSGSEIYTLGKTKGALAHRNLGLMDGYLRKTNSTGGLVWVR